MPAFRPILALLLATVSLPAFAADPAPSLNTRVDRVEKELKAVQRKVFPGGAPTFFEPEIAAAPASVPVSQPTGSALNGLTARIGTLERGMAQMTGQIEQDEHRLNLLSEQAAADRASFDARLKTLEGSGAPAGHTAPTMGDEAPPPIRAAAPVGKTPRTPASRTGDAPPPLATAAPATSTGDPAEDGYMAGYKLWTQKKYPEAEATLKQVVAKYPKHRRASYAQNLLGRALLDDNHPATAAQAFATNYQTNPRGERAPDSLYFLGASLTQLEKPADACKVYDEFDAAYGATAEATLKDKVAAGRKAAKCK